MPFVSISQNFKVCSKLLILAGLIGLAGCQTTGQTKAQAEVQTDVPVAMSALPGWQKFRSRKRATWSSDSGPGNTWLFLCMKQPVCKTPAVVSYKERSLATSINLDSISGAQAATLKNILANMQIDRPTLQVKAIGVVHEVQYGDYKAYEVPMETTRTLKSNGKVVVVPKYVSILAKGRKAYIFAGIYDDRKNVQKLTRMVIKAWLAKRM